MFLASKGYSTKDYRIVGTYPRRQVKLNVFHRDDLTIVIGIFVVLMLYFLIVEKFKGDSLART